MPVSALLYLVGGGGFGRDGAGVWEAFLEFHSAAVAAQDGSRVLQL